jgi:hypothetical protein
MLLGVVLKIAAFTENHAWAAEQLRKMAATQQRLQVQYRLQDVAVPATIDALVPIFRAWLEAEQHGLVCRSLESMGKHNFVKFPALKALLLGIIDDHAASKEHIDLAWRTLVRLEPRVKHALVPTLLQRDPTWIRDLVCLDFVLRHRQDLIEAYLSCPAIKGRLDTGKLPIILTACPPLTRLYGRLTKNQQYRLESALAPLIDSDSRPWDLVSLLGALEYAPTTTLVVQSRVDNKNISTRNIALAALSKMDVGPQVKINPRLF